MTELHIAHTADLAAGQKAAIRGLMDAVFDGVSDDTFDNDVRALIFLALFALARIACVHAVQAGVPLTPAPKDDHVRKQKGEEFSRRKTP